MALTSSDNKVLLTWPRYLLDDQMADHDWVVRKLARFHKDHGDDVYADHYRGFRKPPIFQGPKGGSYRPDIWIPTDGLVYEVEPYYTLERALPQVKAFVNDPRVKGCIVVVSSGTYKGISHLEMLLDRRGVRADVLNWRTLFGELGISW